MQGGKTELQNAFSTEMVELGPLRKTGDSQKLPKAGGKGRVRKFKHLLQQLAQPCSTNVCLLNEQC